MNWFPCYVYTPFLKVNSPKISFLYAEILSTFCISFIKCLYVFRKIVCIIQKKKKIFPVWMDLTKYCILFHFYLRFNVSSYRS